MSFIERIAGYDSIYSAGYYFRSRRKLLYENLISSSTKDTIKILDVGGTVKFWEFMNYHNSEKNITLLNLESDTSKHSNMKFVVGNACHMPEFKDGEFDLVFSNSVIEHVGGFEAQKRMADEIRRVGRDYIVQTPSYYFPIEPHFLFPGFQWFNVKTKAYLWYYLKLGWAEGTRTLSDGISEVSSYNLMKLKDLQKLFPDAIIYKEIFLGLTKSYIAVRISS